MVFLIKGIGLLVTGRTGLTNINFASIGTQVKLIDTMKYF